MRKIAKKAAAVIIAAAVLMCGVGAAFTGCSIKNTDESGTINTDKTVYSNGGTIVQYGDYVYFVNGIPDYTDESGTTNLNGSVVKGGIYRAKINWDRPVSVSDEEDKLFADGVITPDDYEKTRSRATTLYDVLDFEYDIDDYIELHEYTIGTENNSEPATYVDENGVTRQNFVPTQGGASEFSIAVEQVVSKKVGTSGYDGGMWIYDDVIYFASPSTDRDNEGNVEYTRPSFWAYDMTSDALTELYTATENSASVPYAFYKSGDSVYLTTFEHYYANADDEDAGVLTGYIVVNRISGINVVETYELVAKVESVFFPVDEMYDPEDESPADASDLVYLTRKNTESDYNPRGYTLEMISPFSHSGDENVRFSIDTADSENLSVTGLEGGYLYYTKSVTNGNTQLMINSLYTQLNRFDENYNEETCIAPPMGETDPVLCSDTSEYTTILPIPQDSNDMNAPCFMGGNANGIYRVTATGRTQVYNGTITLIGYNSGRIYCTLDTAGENVEDEDASTDTEGDEEEESTSAFISASAYHDFNYQTATILNVGVTPTTTPFSIDFISVNFSKNGNGANMDTTETYVSYFGTYGGTMTDYMYLNKVSGAWESASNVNLKLGEVVFSEAPAITCYDKNCINFLHDHSSWDDYTEDEEEGDNGYFEIEE